MHEIVEALVSVTEDILPGYLYIVEKQLGGVLGFQAHFF